MTSWTECAGFSGKMAIWIVVHRGRFGTAYELASGWWLVRDGLVEFLVVDEVDAIIAINRR